jgi:sterol desaturase/sphingolipid hydroxylase (fatty acid hydroxylase superfamily)
VFPPRACLRDEIRSSLISLALFTAVALATFVQVGAGRTQVYFEVSEYGRPYLWVSILALLVLQDAYFYWTHRLLHWRPLFRWIHATHHRSRNPSPWAAFAFHPLEAVMQAAIVPLAIVVMPLHPWAILGWLLAMTSINVLGHLGYELFPSGFVSRLPSGLFNTSTHHNMHHRLVGCNYGLYANWWDRMLGTNHARYAETFEAVASGRRRGDATAGAMARASGGLEVERDAGPSRV